MGSTQRKNGGKEKRGETEDGSKSKGTRKLWAGDGKDGKPRKNHK
jgi:hypothetical protein